MEIFNADKSTILIVEDNFIVMLELKDRLTEMGYEVVDTAASGEEAITKAGKYKPDLAMMDIRLKGEMDGIEAAANIKKKYDIPVIYLTAHSDEDTLQRAKITEPFGFIIKPFEERELRSTIEMALYKHKIDKRLKENERWLSSTINSVGDALVSVDAGGCIKLVNPVAENLLGIKNEEAVGAQINSIIVIKDEEHLVIENPVITALVNPVMVEGTNCFLTDTKGNEIPIDYSSAPILNEYNTVVGVVMVFRDVSERIKSQKAIEKYLTELQNNRNDLELKANELSALNLRLNQSEQELRALNASKDKFFSIIAHDLRSPFTGLLGFSKHMSEEINSYSREELKMIADKIYQSARSANGLLENLLQWARVKTGRIGFEKTSIDLKSLLEDVIDIYRGNAASKNISLNIRIDKDIIINADLNTIETILRNLISNALKFTHENGEITISAKEVKNGVTVTVADNGVGMTPDQIEKLFQIDQTVTTTGTDNEKGSGLGLILCKEFIELNKGTIEAASKPGEGSQFIITIPA